MRKVWYCLAGLLVLAGLLHAAPGEWVTYPSGDETVRGYLAVPQGSGPFPALIVVHEWWGLNDWIRHNADRFAQNGYLALAVDLYRGAVATERDEARELSRGLPEDRGVRDLKAAFDYLAVRPDVDQQRIGVIGWCMGGGYALRAAQTIPQLAACVVAYGRLSTEMASLVSIRCPLMGVFGSRDRGIPVEVVRTFERNMRELGKSVEIHFFTGVGHAFMNPQNRSGYDEAAANRAWHRIFRFLERYLKRRRGSR